MLRQVEGGSVVKHNAGRTHRRVLGLAAHAEGLDAAGLQVRWIALQQRLCQQMVWNRTGLCVAPNS